MEFKKYKEIYGTNIIEAIQAQYYISDGNEDKTEVADKYNALSIIMFGYGYYVIEGDKHVYIGEDEFLSRYEPISGTGIEGTIQPVEVPWELFGTQYNLTIPKNQMDKIIITLYNICLDNKINCNLIHN